MKPKRGLAMIYSGPISDSLSLVFVAASAAVKIDPWVDRCKFDVRERAPLTHRLQISLVG